MVTHAIDCDMGEDCTCAAGGELELDPVFLQVGMYVAVVPRWAYEMMCELGLDPPLAEVMSPPEHREHGPLEI